MKAEAIKIDLHDKINHANPNQLKDLYGLVVNYLNGSTDEQGGKHYLNPCVQSLPKALCKQMPAWGYQLKMLYATYEPSIS
ncbi:hypothetical protein [Mucilaginibacter myungsuensis]|uniref:Uncharacterized protein n=1 Tax=Mucilaginibacter myungsuensis TaxID=649104 RepID=A0A929KZN2_9SPHI|nr:hypothetical protein [Mucilaginibacter myungsuensis]MBE9663403.1 hypothetical protein [Mucilaginibacter myungsuensis]MDN3600140.1 hypothetical protein [Mucilaginibacter myungsuensis]